MNAHSPEPGQGMASPLDPMDVGRLTWIGLTLAAIGWAILLGEAMIVDILPTKSGHPYPPTFHADLVDIAKCIIASGFGLAIIGALQSGFGTLNRFFSAVLLRSTQRTGTPASTPTEPPPPRERRPYRTLPDGSVEVETIVGTRRFRSMGEAREFI